MSDTKKWVDYDQWHFIKSGRVPNKLIDKEMVNITVTSNHIKNEFEKAIEDRIESLGLKKQMEPSNKMVLDFTEAIENRNRYIEKQKLYSEYPLTPDQCFKTTKDE